MHVEIRWLKLNLAHLRYLFLNLVQLAHWWWSLRLLNRIVMMLEYFPVTFSTVGPHRSVLAGLTEALSIEAPVCASLVSALVSHFPALWVRWLITPTLRCQTSLRRRLNFKSLQGCVFFIFFFGQGWPILTHPSLVAPTSVKATCLGLSEAHLHTRGFYRARSTFLASIPVECSAWLCDVRAVSCVESLLVKARHHCVTAG